MDLKNGFPDRLASDESTLFAIVKFSGRHAKLINSACTFY